MTISTNQKEALLAAAYEGWRSLLARCELDATLGDLLGFEVSTEERAKVWLAHSMKHQEHHFFAWTINADTKTVFAHHASGCTLEIMRSDVVLRFNPSDAVDVGNMAI